MTFTPTIIGSQTAILSVTDTVGRPFWRYREEDEGFCYFMLRGFWILSYIEKLIDSHGRSEKKILRYRKRYALKVWSILRRRCIAVTTGELTGRYTYRKWTFAE